MQSGAYKAEAAIAVAEAKEYLDLVTNNRKREKTRVY